MIGEKPENLANWMTGIFFKKNTQKLNLNLIASERETNGGCTPQHDKRIIPVVTLEVCDICDIPI